MHWYLSNRFDPRALTLADRHYNREKPGTPQFVSPGSCLVLLTERADALWVTSAPLAEYTHHAWAGAWINSLFRNESGLLSSMLIQEAVAATRWYYELVRGEQVPSLGFVTFVDAGKLRVSPKKRAPGYCYEKAGWVRLEETTKQHKLVVMQLLPAALPESRMPLGAKAKALELSRHVQQPVLIV